MPRAWASIATNNWLLTLYLERPLLARTLIQRCQPSVVSRARAACSMRSRSAWRRASRSSSVSGLRLKRRDIAVLLGAWGPPGWRADPPPPARPPGRATIRVASRRASGRRRLRGLVEVLRGLVVDRPVIGLGVRRALGVPLLAGRGLGLVEGAVGALDGLLELAQRGGDVRAGELLERLGGQVLVG